MAESIVGKGVLLGQNGDKVETKILDAADVVGLYFSAHWCPPCRAFTPALAEKYEALRAKGKKFEIVFVSADRSSAEMEKYFDTMPWHTLPHGDSRVKALQQRFNVSGIPSLILLSGESGTVITEHGREAIMLPEDFPWTNFSASGPPSLNKSVTNIAMRMAVIAAGLWITRDQLWAQGIFMFFVVLGAGMFRGEA